MVSATRTARFGAALTLALTLALPASAVYAQATPATTDAARTALSIQSDAGVRLWEKGREDLLAFRLDSARAVFARLGQAEPQSAAGAFGVETAALWQAIVMGSDPYPDRFYTLNDSLAGVAARLPDTPEGRLMRASIGLHRAFLLGREERYARAGLAFRDACGQFRALPSSLPDALFGQGVCEAAAGAIPRRYRWLGRLFGFSGNVASGLDKLARAADGGGAQALEAVVALAIVDAALNERRAGGLDRLRRLAAEHPESPVLAYLDAYNLLQDRQAVEAERVLRRASTALAVPGTAPFPFVDADLGMALFRQDRFEEAQPFLDRYARTYRGRALLAQTTLYAGFSAELTGDRRGAEALYRRVRAAREYDIDQAAARDAARRLAAPMTPTERTLLLGATAFDSGRYDEAIRRVQPILTDASLADTPRAEAAYRSGRAYQALGNGDEALRHFQLVASMDVDPLARWGPWSRYHVGEVHELAGRTAEARAAYRAVLENETEFDFHQTLEQRTRTALARLDG